MKEVYVVGLYDNLDLLQYTTERAPPIYWIYWIDLLDLLDLLELLDLLDRPKKTRKYLSDGARSKNVEQRLITSKK